MWLSVCLPLVFSGLFGLLAPGLARRLPPAVATWSLSGGGLLSAAGSSVSLGLLALVFVAQSPVLERRGHWSDDFLRLHEPLAMPVGALAALAVAVFAAGFARAGAQRLTAVRAAHRLARALPDTGAELAVLDSPDKQAFAVPGRPGRIVATSGLLRGLDAGQRRALLAHEHAHLAHRHHLHQSLTALAVSVNPLLGRLPAALELACERWADEDAALVCQRGTVAAALTRAAVTTRAATVVLGAAGSDVAARVRALHAPAPRLQLWRVGLLTGLLSATAIAVAIALRDVERLFELAQQAYLSGQR